MTTEISYHPSPLFAPDSNGIASDAMAAHDVAAQGVAQFSAQNNPAAGVDGLRSQQRRRSVSLEGPRRSVQVRRQVVGIMRSVMSLLKDLASGKSPTDAWNNRLANRFDWEAEQYLRDFLFATQNPSAPRATSIDANRARVDTSESEDSQSTSEVSQSTSEDCQSTSEAGQLNVPSEWMTLPKPSSLSSLCHLSEKSRERFFGQLDKLCEQSFAPHLKSLSFEQFQKIRAGFAELRANDRFALWPSETLTEGEAYLLLKVEKMVKKEVDPQEKEACASKGRGILSDLYEMLSVGEQKQTADGATARCLPRMTRLDLRLSPINRLARQLEEFEGRRTVDDVVTPHARTWSGVQVLTFMNHIKSAAQALAQQGPDADQTFKWGCDEILAAMSRQCAERPAEVFIENAATHAVDDAFWQPLHDTLNTMGKEQAYAFVAQLNPRQLQLLDSFKKNLGVGSEHIVSAIAAGRAKREGEISAVIDDRRAALERAVETGNTRDVARALIRLAHTMNDFQHYMDLWDMRSPDEAVENGLRTSLSAVDMAMRTSGGVITEKAETEIRFFLARLSGIDIYKLHATVQLLGRYGLDFLEQAVLDEAARREQPAGTPKYGPPIISNVDGAARHEPAAGLPTYEQLINSNVDEAARHEPPAGLPTYEQSIIANVDEPSLRNVPSYLSAA